MCGFGHDDSYPVWSQIIHCYGVPATLFFTALCRMAQLRRRHAASGGVAN